MDSREKALGEVVAGLLDARHDPATARFDEELAKAEAEGRIDPRTATALRWWQRQSLRALVEHARSTVPAAVAALERAREAAELGAAESAGAWARAEAPIDPAGAGEPAPAPQTIDLETRRRLFVAGLPRTEGPTP